MSIPRRLDCLWQADCPVEIAAGSFANVEALMDRKNADDQVQQPSGEQSKSAEAWWLPLTRLPGTT